MSVDVYWGKMAKTERIVADLACGAIAELAQVRTIAVVRERLCGQCRRAKRCEEPCRRARMIVTIGMPQMVEALARWN